MADVKVTTTEEVGKVSAGTIARMIITALLLMNMILSALGYQPIDIADETIYNVVSGIALIISSVISFWKNNSFTKAARKADKIMKEEKAAAKAAK